MSDFEKVAALAANPIGQEKDACGLVMIVAENGQPRADILPDALTALARMTHRAGTGADDKTSDGAGLLIGLPQDFFKKLANAERTVGVGQFYLPQDAKKQAELKTDIETTLGEFGRIVWREVPTDDTQLGPEGLRQKPAMWQAIVERREDLTDDAFERHLLQAERELGFLLAEQHPDAVAVSISAQVIIYKYMVLPERLGQFYSDLTNPDFITNLALGHERFSTNTATLPARVQPLRRGAHNGEINSDTTNVLAAIDRYGANVIPVSSSDSGHLFAMVNYLVEHEGMSLLQAMRITTSEVPDAKLMSPEEYKLASYLRAQMGPWSGPLGGLASDGKTAIAKVDDNALRPVWVIRTSDGRLIAASEDGAVPLDNALVIERRLLEAGEMVAADMQTGEFLDNAAINARLIEEIGAEKINNFANPALKDTPYTADFAATAINIKNNRTDGEWVRLANAIGLNAEEQDRILTTLARTGVEAISSMGDDTAIAPLSRVRNPLYRFMRQYFAQVTNPPIDLAREPDAFSLTSWLHGTKGDARALELKSPILSRHQFATMKNTIGRDDIIKLDATFAADGTETLEEALRRLQRQAAEAIANGFTHIELTHEKTSSERAVINGALAASAVNAHLMRRHERHKVKLHLNAYDIWDSHATAMAITGGADTVCPNLAEAMLMRQGADEQNIENFYHALDKGILKIMSKKGITDINAYRSGAQLEILGLDEKFTEEFIPGAANLLGGFDGQLINNWELERHNAAYNAHYAPQLEKGSLRQQQRDEKAELHGWNSAFIARIHKAVQENDYQAFKDACQIADAFPRAQNGGWSKDLAPDVLQDSETNNSPLHLRHLLNIKKRPPIPLEQVESVENIIKRFVIEAMSYGALSEEAQVTIFEAARKMGIIAVSGEGGERPEWLHKASCAQVASARFGVTCEFLTGEWDPITQTFGKVEIQIKMAQGAKPGEGGQMLANKVTPEIAKTRGAEPYKSLASPAPHHDIYSIEDLAQLIFDLKTSNPNAKIGVKLVSTSSVSTIAVGVVKAGAENVLIAGHNGGTGASPDSSIHGAGMPTELGLWTSHLQLIANNLRGRATLEADGMMRTPGDAIKMSFFGAERFGFGTLPLIAMLCDMQGQCQGNPEGGGCGAGITGQNPELRSHFNAKADYIINLFTFMAQGCREELAAIGAKSFDDIHGQAANWLTQAQTGNPYWDSLKLDRFLQMAAPPLDLNCATSCAPDSAANDNEPVDKAVAAYLARDPDQDITVDLGEVNPTHRNIGTALSGVITRDIAKGSNSARAAKVTITSQGAAGQSWGCLVRENMTLIHEGTVGGGAGKMLADGAHLVIKKPANDNIPEGAPNYGVGGSALYGATGGKFDSELGVGARFAVRNSNASAVVRRNAGRHACTFMTGGEVLLGGRIGNNAFSGMSGGVAFNYDPTGDNRKRMNDSTVKICRLSELKGEQKIEMTRRLTALTTRYETSTGDTYFNGKAEENYWVILPKPAATPLPVVAP